MWVSLSNDKCGSLTRTGLLPGLFWNCSLPLYLNFAFAFLKTLPWESSFSPLYRNGLSRLESFANNQCSNLWSLTEFCDHNFFRVIHISNRTLKLPNCDNDCIRILIKLHFNIFRTSWYWRDSIHCTYSEGRRSSESEKESGQVSKSEVCCEGKLTKSQVKAETGNLLRTK